MTDLRVAKDGRAVRKSRLRRSAVLLAATTLVACGPPGAGSRPEPVRTQTIYPDGRHDLHGVHPVSWEKVRVTEDGRQLVVTYIHGHWECRLIDRVEVEYRSESIVVTFFHGLVSPQEACPTIGFEGDLAIDLLQPVGGRPIRDGAPGPGTVEEAS